MNPPSSTTIALLLCNCCETTCFSGVEVRNKFYYLEGILLILILGDGDDDEDSDD